MQSQDFHKLLEQRRTFFCYSGLLSEDVLSTFSGIVREQMSEMEDDAEITKRVWHLRRASPECDSLFQGSNRGGGTGTAAISRAEMDFIEVINPMDHENAEGLRKNLDELKAMDKGTAQGLQTAPA